MSGKLELKEDTGAAHIYQTPSEIKRLIDNGRKYITAPIKVYFYDKEAIYEKEEICYLTRTVDGDWDDNNNILADRKYFCVPWSLQGVLNPIPLYPVRFEQDDFKTFSFEGIECPIGWTLIKGGDVPSAEFFVEAGCLPDIRKAIDNASDYLKSKLSIDFYETDEDDTDPIGTMTRAIDGSWDLDADSEIAEGAYNGNLVCFFFDTLYITVDLK